MCQGPDCACTLRLVTVSVSIDSSLRLVVARHGASYKRGDEIRRDGKGKAREGTPITGQHANTPQDAPQRVNMVRDCVLDARAISGRIIPHIPGLSCFRYLVFCTFNGLVSTFNDRNAIKVIHTELLAYAYLNRPSEGMILSRVVRDQKKFNHFTGVFIYWAVAPFFLRNPVSLLCHGF